MRSFFLFLLFISVSALYAQDKYLIYFKDKGPDTSSIAANSLNKEIITEQFLSKRSIERRKKILGDNFFNIQDLPVHKDYISEIESIGIKIVHKLKWFNAVSTYLTAAQLNVIEELEFVDRIDRVKSYRKAKKVDRLSKAEEKTSKLHSNNNIYDYGNSLTQNIISSIPQVHNLGITGEGVVIGILDSGFDWKNHPALKDRDVIAEFDFIYKDNVTANDSKDVTSSQHNHGTNVFSIMAGFHEGNLVGPAFNAKFILAKTEFVPTETHVEEDNFAAALEWMDSIGVDITSTSLGYSDFDAPEFSYTYNDMNGKTTIVTKAAEMAFERGILTITSAGNEGNKNWRFITAPGDGAKTLTVGAVNSNNNLAGFSSRGPTSDGRIKPEVVAQGVSVYRALGSSDGYSFGDGTSFSAPIVSGIAALLLSAHPHLNNEQIRDIIIKSSGNYNNPNNDVGYGLTSAICAITTPNIQKINNDYIINKIFTDSVNSNIESVKISYKLEDSENIIIDDFNATSTIAYNYQLPTQSIGNNLEFYIEAYDANNVLFSREPKDGVYLYKYGDLVIDKKNESPEPPIVPNKIILEQNFPNPFNSETQINFSIPSSSENSNVSIRVFDVLGREVVKLLDEKLENIQNNSVTLSSSGLSSGIYFYQLIVDNVIKTKKLTILK